MKPTRMRFGPLCYEFRALDQWAQQLLGAIKKYFDLKSFHGAPDRIFHIKGPFCQSKDGQRMAAGDHIPFDARIELRLPRTGWQQTSDAAGHIFWFHKKNRHTFWSFNKEYAHFKTLYQLPLVLMQMDMLQRHGALLHGGLIGHKKKGYLLIAPPGGGKTTAIKRVASPWRIYSDDAALVWMDENNICWASAMPTWSVMTGRSKHLPALSKWSCSERVQIAGIYKLVKATSMHLKPLPAIETVPFLYRALCEYPGIAEERSLFKNRIFHLAAALSKTVPTNLIYLNKSDKYWELLEIRKTR